MDTQWPRYLVFHQAAADRPHVHAGSVHAPDADLALMNARDVFVRRPACVSLWVVRADRVYSRTREELLEGAMFDKAAAPGDSVRYAVFQKRSHAGACTFVGHVKGLSPSHALEAALAVYSESDPLVWWLVPDEEIARTEAAEAESLFEPAGRKDFRSASDFKTLTAMRQIRRKGEGDDPDGT